MADTENKPMALDGGGGDEKQNVGEAEQPKAVESVARQGDQYRPYCRVHNCLMGATNSNGKVTRYQCPVPGCKEAEKRTRPNTVVPNQPLECPQCRQRAIEEAAQKGGKGKKEPKPVYCEVDRSRSRGGMLRMVCPTDGCSFAVDVPRPDIAIVRRQFIRRSESISAR
jgi:hypothetical protein